MSHEQEQDFECSECGGDVSPKRWALGYKICLDCGDHKAKKARELWTIVPTHKGAYTRITNPEELKHLNQKPK